MQAITVVFQTPLISAFPFVGAESYADNFDMPIVQFSLNHPASAQGRRYDVGDSFGLLSTLAREMLRREIMTELDQRRLCVYVQARMIYSERD
ncbi:hypothetical protein [Roseibium marinum]|uniref:hypothetical protein n=1 Tax=Roseibium marinum TaxID=281252 RepID=UPI0014766C57|nr:hypothetical protein [Roseibium marinum]